MVIQQRNEIRTRLQHGMTIQEACQEYDLTFNQLVALLHKGQKKPKTSQNYVPTGEKYIICRHGRYSIRKNDKWFGTYETLEDACKIRDWFIEWGSWNKHFIMKACRETGVVRCTSG